VAAVALAFGAGLAWGCSDFLARLKSRRLAVLWVLLVSQGTGLLLAAVVAGASGEPLPGPAPIAWAALAGVAELIGFAALYRGLAIGAMSVVAPVSATAAIVPVFVGVAVGQPPTAPDGAGIALALGGAALASVERDHAHAPRHVAAGMAPAVLAAASFGVFFVGTDMAADDGALWAVALSRLTAVAVLGAAVVLRHRPCPLDRGACAPLAAVGLLDISANAMFAVAPRSASPPWCRWWARCIRSRPCCRRDSSCRSGRPPTRARACSPHWPASQSSASPPGWRSARSRTQPTHPGRGPPPAPSCAVVPQCRPRKSAPPTPAQGARPRPRLRDP
jgi:uncharacterized membrane protein